jgi:hypothetical protein
VGGKTVAETLSTPAALGKAQREVAEFRKFQELSRKLVEINEAICRGRPVEEEASRRRKKTADAIHHEVAAEVDRLLRIVFSEQRRRARIDLEAVEMAVRSALHRAGAAALSQLLAFPAQRGDHDRVIC